MKTGERIYTLELYTPAYPANGRYARAHAGELEENRDNLNPSMVLTRRIVLTDPMQTITRDLKKFAKELNAKAIPHQ